jgi:hypothetical protein
MEGIHEAIFKGLVSVDNKKGHLRSSNGYKGVYAYLDQYQEHHQSD